MNNDNHIARALHLLFDEMGLATEWGRALQHTGSVTDDGNDRVAAEQAKASEDPDTAPCGHSACRQNFIDTGESVCVKDVASPQVGQPAPDPETVAYIAIGADLVMREPDSGYDADVFEGHINYINECTRWAIPLDEAFAPMIEAGDLTVCFAYEVAEEFGMRYGKYLMRERTTSDGHIARHIIDDLLEEVRQERNGPMPKRADLSSSQREYRVRWEIDVEADSPEAAARQARKHQTAPGTTATVFDVTDLDTMDSEQIDLTALDEQARGFTTPDCPKCGCVDNGQCLCSPLGCDMPLPTKNKPRVRCAHDGRSGTVVDAKPITPDVLLRDTQGRVVLSYGPRKESDDETVRCPASEAQFWSAFTHDNEGHACILCDCYTEWDARAVCDKILGDRNAFLASQADVARLNDEVLDKQRTIDDLRRYNENQRQSIEHLTRERDTFWLENARLRQTIDFIRSKLD